MKRWTQASAVAVMGLLIAVAQAGAADAPVLREFIGLRAVVVAVVVGALLVWVDLRSSSARGPARQPDAESQRINLSSLKQLMAEEASSTVALARRSAGVLDGAVRAEAADGGPVAVVRAPRTTRAVLLGEAGSGKSTTLAQLALAYMDEEPSHPVAVLRLGEWLEDGDAVSALADKRFERWLSRRLSRHYELTPAVVDWWIDQDLLVLLLDGLDELELAARVDMVAALLEFVDDHKRIPVVISCRYDEHHEVEAAFAYPDLRIQRWTMPALDREVVVRTLDDVLPDAHELAPHDRELFVTAMSQPIWLSMLRVDAPTDDLPSAAETVEAYHDWAIARFKGAALADDDSGELGKVLGWIASSVKRTRTVSFSLSSLSTALLPPGSWRVGRFYQGLGLSVAALIYGGVATALVGMGWRCVPLAISYAALVILLCVSPIGGRVIAAAGSPSILEARRWNAPNALRMVRLVRQEVANRAILLLAGGLVVGGLVALVSNVDRPEWVTAPVPRALLLLLIPLLTAALGGPVGGAIGGILLIVVVGFGASVPVAVAGGLVAALYIFVVFGAAHYGEVVRLYRTEVGRPQLTIAKLLDSSVRTARYDVVTWLMFGIPYGVTMYLVSGGDSDWLFLGLLLAGGGAFIYGVAAFFWPRATVWGVERGLQHAGTLERQALEEVLLELQARSLLVPALGGAVLRFSHPLLLESFSSDATDGRRRARSATDGSSQATTSRPRRP